MTELIAAGCRYIQIDAPDLAEAYADRAVREGYARDAGMEPEEFLSVATELICGLGQLERPDQDPDVLRGRIAEAARFHPKNRLAIGPQCGFASASETAEQRKVTPQTQVDKLNLIGEVARSVWN